MSTAAVPNHLLLLTVYMAQDLLVSTDNMRPRIRLVAPQEN